MHVYSTGTFVENKLSTYGTMLGDYLWPLTGMM